MNGNHDLNLNLVRKRTPYMDAINRYIFDGKGDSFWVEESLTCCFLNPSVKFDYIQRVTDGDREPIIVNISHESKSVGNSEAAIWQWMCMIG